jgi:type I restriction enzyme, S subunit
MSLLDFIEDDGPGWTRIGDLYEVTRKPRGLDLSSFETIPFTPMEAIPQGGLYSPGFVPKAPGTITSGTYFERGDLLVAKITPSFENGKQALTFDLPAPFGYATTEVIPLRPRKSGQDRRLLFFYLLHPDIRHYVAERMEGSTGRQRVPENVLLDLPFPEVKPEEQSVIADALEIIQRNSMAELRCEDAVRELKRAAMRTLFTRGLRGEAQKENRIWFCARGLDRISARRMRYGSNRSCKRAEVFGRGDDGGTLPACSECTGWPSRPERNEANPHP